MVLYNVDIRNKERETQKEMKMKTIEEYFRIETVTTTDSCGEYCSHDAQICPACLEHCEVIVEEIEVYA